MSVVTRHCQCVRCFFLHVPQRVYIRIAYIPPLGPYIRIAYIPIMYPSYNNSNKSGNCLRYIMLK